MSWLQAGTTVKNACMYHNRWETLTLIEPCGSGQHHSSSCDDLGPPKRKGADHLILAKAGSEIDMDSVDPEMKSHYMTGHRRGKKNTLKKGWGKLT